MGQKIMIVKIISGHEWCFSELAEFWYNIYLCVHTNSEPLISSVFGIHISSCALGWYFFTILTSCDRSFSLGHSSPRIGLITRHFANVSTTTCLKWERERLTWLLQNTLNSTHFSFTFRFTGIGNFVSTVINFDHIYSVLHRAVAVKWNATYISCKLIFVLFFSIYIDI